MLAVFGVILFIYTRWGGGHRELLLCEGTIIMYTCFTFTRCTTVNNYTLPCTALCFDLSRWPERCAA
jgi:hypothetical protein